MFFLSRWPSPGGIHHWIPHLLSTDFPWPMDSCRLFLGWSRWGNRYALSRWTLPDYINLARFLSRSRLLAANPEPSSIRPTNPPSSPVKTVNPEPSPPSPRRMDHKHEPTTDVETESAVTNEPSPERAPPCTVCCVSYPMCLVWPSFPSLSNCVFMFMCVLSIILIDSSL